MAEVEGTAHRAEMHEGLKSQFDVIVDGRIVVRSSGPDAFRIPARCPTCSRRPDCL